MLKPLPAPTTLEDRLGVFPQSGHALEGPVEIRWNEQQVPFIRAQTDGDAAYALGLVHAHLRLGQMEVMRMLAEGRAAEMAGPVAVDIDEILRILGFGRAVPELEKALPDETRAWIERFVSGINAYTEGLEKSDLPHEFAVLNLKRRPWTVADVLTVGRLAGSDVTWFTYFSLIPYRDDPEWAALWERFKKVGVSGMTSFAFGPAEEDPSVNALARTAALTQALSRSGSNSMVLGAERSKTGAPLIANDPHLGFNFPNLWIIAGIQSPSFHVVGMMPPGMPVFGFGRNKDFAWGGTNLRALSSDLVRVDGLPAEAFSEEEHLLKVRYWRNKKIRSRMSPYGPVLSDAKRAPEAGEAEYALRWMGHEMSDEPSALLNVMKGGDLKSFTAALETFSVPGQNFLYAGRDGTIAHVLATRVPARDEGYFEDVLLTPEASDRWWGDVKAVQDLPMIVNPVEGALGSANNRPTPLPFPAAGFFSQDERIRRVNQLLSSAEQFDMAGLKAMQKDTKALLSLELNKAFLTRMKSGKGALCGAGPAGEAWAEGMAALEGWDGTYEKDSKAALYFEAFYGAFTRTISSRLGTTKSFKRYEGLGIGRLVILQDLPSLADDVFCEGVEAAKLAVVEAVGRGESWGDVHRLRVQHFLANIPVLGRKYRFGDYPTAGSRDTVYKTGHATTVETHRAFYGSQSRHLSDMADPDENYFVLLGGQDGWLNSSTFDDQVTLWFDGAYVRLPLTEAAVNEALPRSMVLEPAG